MPKRNPVPRCSEKDRQLLEEWSKSRTIETRLVERAKMVQGCPQGKTVKRITQELGVRPNTVIEWRRRCIIDHENWSE